MKLKNIAFYLFIITASSLKGQVQFLDSTYVWTEFVGGGFPFSSGTGRHTFSSEPTLINGLIYYQRLRSFDATGNNWHFTDQYYRIDDSSRVYVTMGEDEKLVYDYNLMVNDSFYQPNSYTDYMVVDYIDSIELENGELRKRLAMRCSFDDDPSHSWGYHYWIEGLGGTNGVNDFYPEDCIIDGDAVSTICIHRNDTLIYFNSSADSCWLVGTNIFDPGSQLVVLSPNPAYEFFNLQSDIEIEKILVFDIAGVIQLQTITLPVNIQALPQGYYVVDIRLRNKFRLVKKLIKV